MAKQERTLFYQPKKKTGKIWLVYFVLMIGLGIALALLLPPWFKQLQAYSDELKQEETVIPNVQAPTGIISPLLLANQEGRVSDIKQVPAQGGWINSEPLNLPALAASGHYVLIYFWSAAMPQSYRANQQVQAWWDAYRNSGLLVVGVHTPKYQVDTKPGVVLAAVKQQGLTFPVLLDAHGQIARAFNQSIWPTWQLMDPHGQMILRVKGEVEYKAIEKLIRSRLVDDGWKVPPQMVTQTQLEPTRDLTTPDLYLGLTKMRRQLGNGLLPPAGKVASYTLPLTQDLDSVYLDGAWKGGADALRSQSQGTILVNYVGSAIYLTMGSSEGSPLTVTVLLDGKPVPNNLAGPDLQSQQGQSSLVVTDPRVYVPLKAGLPAERHTLTLLVPPSLDVYELSFADWKSHT